jgi:hypothetical protein
MFMFALHAAGRSLGLDAWLRRHVPAVRDGTGFIGKLLNVASCGVGFEQVNGTLVSGRCSNNQGVVMPRAVFGMLLVLAMCFAAYAQQPASPYAGYEQRPIKALSDQQIADLRAGRGMGLAVAAELNGYPGPVHVLELAAPLELTVEQRAKTQELFEAMKAETVPLGERLIAREAELDQLFATKAVDETALASAVAAIGETQASLRTAHLRFHLRTVEVLTSLQMQRYSELRGYGGSEGAQRHVPMHH